MVESKLDAELLGKPSMTWPHSLCLREPKLLMRLLQAACWSHPLISWRHNENGGRRLRGACSSTKGPRPKGSLTLLFFPYLSLGCYGGSKELLRGKLNTVTQNWQSREGHDLGLDFIIFLDKYINLLLFHECWQKTSDSWIREKGL